MPIVRKGPTDTNDSLIRKFSKKVILDGFLTDLRDKERYKKPSTLKKERMSQLKRKSRRRPKEKWAK